MLPAHLDFPAEGDGRRTAGPATDETEALAGLRQVISWAWKAGDGNLWPKLRDLLKRELVNHAAAELKSNHTQIGKRLSMSRGTVIQLFKEYGLD